MLPPSSPPCRVGDDALSAPEWDTLLSEVWSSLNTDPAHTSDLRRQARSFFPSSSLSQPQPDAPAEPSIYSGLIGETETL